MFNYQPLTIRDVTSVLDSLRHVQRPYGDNEGDPLNHPTVYCELPPETQHAIDCAWQTVRDYCLHPGGDVNKRAVGLVGKRGYSIALETSQHDPLRLSGTVEIGTWQLDLSDEQDEQGEW